jgi:hypothetical protein
MQRKFLIEAPFREMVSQKRYDAQMVLNERQGNGTDRGK